MKEKVTKNDVTDTITYVYDREYVKGTYNLIQFLVKSVSDYTPSRPGEFHPESLTDPRMNLSTHGAPATSSPFLLYTSVVSQHILVPNDRRVLAVLPLLRLATC